MHFLSYAPRALCGLFVALLLFSESQAQADINLRVMSANLTSGNAQRYEAPGLHILQGLTPDIVAIQEFKYSNSTPAEIRSMVDTTFGTNFSYFRESGFDTGNGIPNGIISRYPIVEAGSWVDPVIVLPNRGFAWAKIELPDSTPLYVVSVHLYAGGTPDDRNDQAIAIKNHIQNEFPSGAWVVVAGDFNTSSRGEPAISTFTSFLSDSPIPTDAESGGDPDTNAGRGSPYDYVLPSFSFTNKLAPVVMPSRTFSNGLVFDSRVYVPLTDVPPVLSTDSGAVNMQHMGVLKDFRIPTGTNNQQSPVILTQPQNQATNAGSDVRFSVLATGTQPLTYQWRFNGSNIGGAVASSYLVVGVQATNAGAYSVIVSNVAGSVLSSNATLTVNSAPIIVQPPLSQTATLGDNVNFFVVASGPAPLAFQWLFNGSNLPGATSSTYTRTNAQAGHAGEYSAVVTNSFGAVTSEVAVLSFNSPQAGAFARWDFNSINPDADATTGTITPALGNGTALSLGGVTTAFFGGSAVDPGTNDNSGWSTTTYPTQGTGNKTAGVRFNVSTLGWKGISIRWDQRASTTGSKYARLQYTTNGTSFVDFPTAVALTAANTFQPLTNNLANLPGVDNNPNFAFRIVAEFESSAANTVNSNYVAAGTSYGTAGTLRFDMVTVTGVPNSSNAPASPAVLSSPSYHSGQFQFSLQGSVGTNYIVQASTNLAGSNWLSLMTNTAPFGVVDTNATAFPQRFYRAVPLP